MAGHVHRATILWQRGEGDFAKGRYSRRHLWRFDGGVEVVASASPSVVPPPLSAADAVDPEEAFVAALSSCHMLTFLDLSRRAGFVIERYEDAAEGVMGKGDDGRWWVASVTLRPAITFAGGGRPDAMEIERLHHEAHALCFIANSVKTEVRVAPPATAATP